MSIVTTSPTLSYVSSQDVSIAPSGTTNYMILFDASNTFLSKVIMFEYKFQNLNETIPNLDNTVFGFVAVENAIQSGIVNQYIISIPVTSQLTTDGLPLETIQVRVYYGDEYSDDVIVSDWSNELEVHIPPLTPIIFTNDTFHGAYYDPSLGDLFVLLKESENTYNFNNINFITCFFYQDNSNTTLWKVSDPTTAQSTFIGPTPFKYIQVPLEGTVSTDPSYNKVYVSIHAHYDWQYYNSYYSKSYHSVSYMSNEVQAILASEDSTPDITSVVYNVYTSPLAVPGDQTMTITWIPPGNDPVPFFAVEYYQLYYAVDGSSSFVLYKDNISRETLTETVNVGASGLNLTCGQSIVFRVNAVNAQGDNTPSLASGSTNIFKYSEAVNNLEITDATWNGTNLVGFKVNFNGVSDSGSPNKGCGAGLQYVVEINNTVLSGSGSLVYVSDASYSIVYSDLSIPQVGNVTVYLQTLDTNSSNVMNGLSLSVPYIANTILLDPVVYQVYETQVNTDQYMNLSWSDPSLNGWLVEQYEVQYSTDGGTNWISETTTNSLSYTFDASSFATTSSTNISFRILATMENGSTQYVITSNTVSQYTFKYAEDVQEPNVNWSVANNNNTTMDVNVQFKNPLTTGVNNGLQYFIVTVRDGTANAISSQTINYVSGQTSFYYVNFNNITYSFEGDVSIQAFVNDTNGGGLITSPNYEQNPGYQTSTVPIFNNVVASGGSISGEIITHDLLKPTGVVIIPNSQSSGLLGTPLPYSTLGSTPGFTINYITQTNDELLYSFNINIQTFFGNTPAGCVITAANNAGIGNGGTPIIKWSSSLMD